VKNPRTWSSGSVHPLPLGRLAFQLGADCFVALVRGRRKDQGSEARGWWVPGVPGRGWMEVGDVDMADMGYISSY